MIGYLSGFLTSDFYVSFFRVYYLYLKPLELVQLQIYQILKVKIFFIE